MRNRGCHPDAPHIEALQQFWVTIETSGANLAVTLAIYLLWFCTMRQHTIEWISVSFVQNLNKGPGSNRRSTWKLPPCKPLPPQMRKGSRRLRVTAATLQGWAHLPWCQWRRLVAWVWLQRQACPVQAKPVQRHAVVANGAWARPCPQISRMLARLDVCWAALVGQTMLLAMASMPLASVAFDVHNGKRGFCKRWRCTRQWTAIKAYTHHCCAKDALGSRGQLVRQAPQGHERRQRLGHTPRWSTVQLRAGASTCRRTHGCTRLAQQAPQSTWVHICNKARRPPEQLRREAPEIVFGLHHVDA